MSRCFGRSGLPADNRNIFGHIMIAVYILICRVDFQRLLVPIASRICHAVGRHLNNFVKEIIFQRLLKDQLQIICRNIMPLFRQPVRIGKMTVRRAQRRRLFVHLLYEISYGAADTFRDHNRYIIG